MSFPRESLLCAAGGALGVCVGAVGACAGFLLGSWPGLLAGFAVGAGLFLAAERVQIALCHLHMDKVMRKFSGTGVEEEATANVLMRAVLVYEAAAFPLVPGGVRPEELECRRVIAYRFASYERLPRRVRVAAAGALEAIDESRDEEHVRDVVQTLNRAVRACRSVYIHVSGSRTS